MTELKRKSWYYLGEGNANIVIAVPEDLKVLRFRKSDNPLSDQQLLLEFLYIKHIIEPMLRGFVQVPSILYMKQKYITKMEEAMKSHRPVHRQSKHISSNFVMMFDDYTKLPKEISSKPNLRPVFCVELKPKQGWMHPDDRYLPKCKFCSNQYLKVMDNNVRKQSKYCPYDLFSGNYTRMKRAIKNLLLSPQNNLRIFKNGDFVYGEGSSMNHLSSVLHEWFSSSLDSSPNGLLQKFCDVVIRALTYVKSDVSPEIEQQALFFDNKLPTHLPHSLVQSAAQMLSENECVFGPECLPRNCVLDLIIRGQQQQTRGASWIYHKYKQYERLQDYKYIKMLFKKDLHPDLAELHRYLLAGTLKDCSVMVTFQQTDKSPSNRLFEQILSEDGVSFSFNVHITDIDPKPWSSIEKHQKRDLRILQACTALA